MQRAIMGLRAVGLVPLPVEIPAMEKAALEAVSDSASRKIMNSAIGKARSVEEIACEIGVPMSTVYRHVRELRESGILVVAGTAVTDEGRTYSLYRSALKRVEAALSAGGVKVLVVLNDGPCRRPEDAPSAVPGPPGGRTADCAANA